MKKFLLMLCALFAMTFFAKAQITDDFESYTAFTVDPAGIWTYYDGDSASTYGINGCTFTNANYVGSCIVFNPSQTSPSSESNYPAHSGSQFLVMFNAIPATIVHGSTTNDWLISPAISSTTGSILTFYAREITANYGAETMNILYSTTSNNPSDFTLLQTEAINTTTWTMYSYSIPANATYVAINCTSDDIFGLCIDDISITPVPGDPSIASVSSLNLGNVILPNNNVATVPVQVWNLTSALTASSSDAVFELSFDGTNFASTATISNPVDSTYTLYVKFTPTTGGTATGVITLSSTGATSVNVALTGNGVNCSNNPLPYSFAFDNVEQAQCWTTVDVNNDANGNQGAILISTSSGYAFYQYLSNAAANDWLISPTFYIPENGATASFDYKVAGSEFPEKYSVYVIPAGSTYTSAVPIVATQTVDNEAYETQYLDLDAYAGESIQIGIKVESDADQYAIMFSNFYIGSELPVTLTATPQTVNFGEVIVGNTPTAMVVLNSTNLNENITLTTNAPYGISYNGSAYSTTLTIPANADFEVNDTIYVQYNPTAAGNYNGFIAVSSSTIADTILLSGSAIVCDAITLPFTETFDATSPSRNCWTLVSNNTSNVGGTYGMGYLTYQNREVLRFSSYSSASDYNQYAFSPLMNVSSSATNLQVSVTYATHGTGDYLYFGYITPTDTIWDPTSYQSTNFETLNFVIPATATQLAVHYYGNFKYYAWIDSVEITEMTGEYCYPVTNLNARNIYAHEATLTWSGDANNYTIYDLSDSSVVATISDTTHTLTSLAADSLYSFGVVANCSSSNSNMVVVNFRTQISCPAPTGLAAVLTPGNGTIATLNWHEIGTANAWQICLNGDETNLIDVTDTTSYNLSNLTAEQTYTAKVRAYCDVDEQSAWSNTITFTPTNAYTVTVNDGTSTNAYVPIYGLYVDEITHSQFIIPATDLTSMLYGSISKLTFYCSSANVNWGAATFNVYVTETNETTLSALVDYSTMNQVYAGSLSIVNNTMEVSFTSPYLYMGGNLMIGFDQTLEGEYAASYWYGVTATGASMGGYNSSVNQRNFLPKTTIAYTPGTAPATDSMIIHLSVNNPALGSITPVPGSYAIALNDSIVLHATPNEGANFQGWRVIIAGQTLATVPENPFTIPVSPNNITLGEITIVALFSDSTSVPDSMTIVINTADPTMGTTNPAPGTYNFAVGSTSYVTAVPNEGYHLLYWIEYFEIAGMSVSDTLIADTVIVEVLPIMAGMVSSLTAHFEADEPATDSLIINLTINDPTLGTIDPNPGTYAVALNDVMMITATPNDGVTFEGYRVYWNGQIITNVPAAVNPFPCTVTPDLLNLGEITIMALFSDGSSVPDSLTLIVNTDDATMGTTDPAPGIYSYAVGDTSVLSAIPNDGYHFLYWIESVSVAGITMNDTIYAPVLTTLINQMMADMTLTVTAYFEANEPGVNYYTVIVRSANTAMGTVSSDIPLGQLAENTVVTVTATPRTGYQFINWTDGEGNIINATNPYTFTVTEDITLVANFELADGINDIDASNVLIYAHNSTITVRGAEGHDVSVYDMNGRCIYQRADANETENISMSSAGIYLVRIDNAIFKKVVIVK
ncbi:MAG: choice-of-anchor J domain-containing protein [Bacteroidales bacterium]|nr:choice-of-anchor J domain-containing protein [Bacteroidales bacterium]